MESVVPVSKRERLHSPEQWLTWLSSVRSLASDLKVWKLIDPDIADDQLVKPIEEPTEPPMPSEDVNEVNQLQYRTWGYQMDLFKIRHANYKEQQRALAHVNALIKATVHEDHQYSLEDKDTARERLVFLKSRFGRSNDRFETIRKQWKATSHLPPKRGTDIDKWLSEWLRLYDVAQSLKVQIVYADRDFLEAVKDISGMRVWWTRKHESIISNDREADVHELVEEFRSQYREFHPKASPAVSTLSNAAFSTLQGHSDTPYNDRSCPCGAKGNHKPWNCWTMNDQAPGRPTDFQPPQKRKENVEKVLSKDPGYRNWISQKIKDHQGKIGQKAIEPAPTSSANSAFQSDLAKEFQTSFCTMALNTSVSGLKNRWILDNAASMHICNDRSKFITFKQVDRHVQTGDASTHIEGSGTVEITGSYKGEERVIIVSNVSYCPGFHTNLVSYGALKQKGAKWDEDNSCIKDSEGRPVLGLTFLPDVNLWRFDHSTDTEYGHAYAVQHSKKPLASTASLDVWHRRMGHASHKVVRKAAEMVKGIEITDSSPSNDICETCKLSSAPRQISRRPIGQTFGRFGQISFDLIQMPVGYNQHQWITHFYVEGIRFHWMYTHAMKSECRDAVERFIALVKNWWNLPIKAFHYDNEVSAGRTTEDFLTTNGIIVSHSVAGQPEQNGPSERSGGVIVQMARQLRIEGRLPNELWPEIVAAAVWILNRIPTYKDSQWIVPWDEARKHFAGDRMKLSNLSNLRMFGSLAYCRSKNIPRKDKLKPRAEIGFLVGYIASNVWKIWFPARGKVEAVRDAIFDESRRYREGMQLWEEIRLPQPEPTVLSDYEALDVLRTTLGMPATVMNDVEDDRGDHRSNDVVVENSAPTPLEGHRSEFRLGQSEATKNAPYEALSEAQNAPQTPRVTRSPSTNAPSTVLPGAFPAGAPPPTPVTPAAAAQGVEAQGVQDDLPATADIEQQVVQRTDPDPSSSPSVQTIEPIEIDASDDDDASQQLQQEIHTITRRSRDDGTDISNIIEGPRTRRPRIDHDFQAHATTIADDPPELLKAFAFALYTENPIRHHRDDLPPEPSGWHEMQKHPYKQGFEEACRKEIQGLADKGTFEVIDRPKDLSKQVIPLRWVFKYKFDQDGYLTKLKARICVRGDLETISAEDKRAATLAARTARMLFSLVAAFDLDLRQRDAVGAFLNSNLPTETYTSMPQGFELPRKCWKLNKALYGLRISPKLWQQEASKVLTKLGLTPIPEDPCVFVKPSDCIILWFYVDDILIANHPSKRVEARKLEQQLEQHWELTDHGDAGWFLGVRILRDRQRRRLWLCQDSYIQSIAMRYNLTSRGPVFTPLSTEDLKKYEGNAGAQETKLYQGKVGSAQYATTATRPDASFAVSKLSQFLTNPGPEHLRAIDRLICYLLTTCYYAIAYCGAEELLSADMKSVQFASDAAYADMPDRRSSAGFIIQVYGGPVDWKAAKQPTITTSTTEAELLALSDSAKSLQWWRRFMKRIDFVPDHRLSIRCDNQRTVDLVSSKDLKIATKLRHVDINGQWIRQEIQDGRIDVEWTPTAQMVADGLTKALPRQKHDNFLKMLRMEDIKDLINP